jgi:hypothetical protein
LGWKKTSSVLRRAIAHYDIAQSRNRRTPT